MNDLPGHYRDILTGLGEDPEREGLRDTPTRAAKAMQYLCGGYQRSRRKSSTAPCSPPTTMKW